MTDKHHQAYLDGRRCATATLKWLTQAILSMGWRIDERVTTTEGTPTMAVNDRHQCICHPAFLDEIMESGGGKTALGFVIAHEAWHILRKHVARILAMMRKLGNAFDPKRSGIAVDLDINFLLRLAANMSPVYAGLRITVPVGNIQPVFPEQFKLEGGLTYEMYYQRLGEPGGSGKGGGSGQGSGSGKPSPGASGSSPPGQSPPQPQQGPPQAQEGPGSPRPTMGCSPGDGSLSKAAEEVFAEMGPGMSEPAQQQLVKKILEEAQKQRGTVPLGLFQLIAEELEPPRVDWRDVLHSRVSYLAEHRPGAQEWSFSMPSRRQAGIGYGAGCPILPGSVEHELRVAVVADTSGSMRGHLKTVLGETMGIAEALGDEVRLLAIDTIVHSDVRVDGEDAVRAAIKGGGGTDMRKGFELLRENPPDVCICVTDGAIGEVGAGPGCPTLFVLVENEQRYVRTAVAAGWGEILEAWEE